MRILLSAFLLLSVIAHAEPLKPCRIEVVEKGSGWPVPLIELRTTHQVRFITDNAGLIAMDAPELMGRETWFEVVGHGYEATKDGFGFRGFRLKPEPGKTLRVEVNRNIMAKRIGRLTGAGLFAESQKLGEHLDLQDSGIHGCDSVQNAVHDGLLFWAWGDTNMPNYPLGLFDMSSATTAIQPLQSMEPPLKLKFDYFTDGKGRQRGVAKMPGKGPTWVSGYVSLPDKTGKARLVGSYVKIKPPMDAYETGLCVWNEKTEQFDLLRVLWTQSEKSQKPPPMPEGQPAFWKDAQDKEWVLHGNPLPVLRHPATFEAWQDASTWEVLKPQETMSTTDGGKVTPHSGSIAWNAYRGRWVTIFMEKFGKPSAFGELWYAECESPTGNWGPAIKVLTHENYTFYNPRIHPEFAGKDSPLLFFEGTYTKEFANHAHATPRYDYNQILYRLDLDDPALKPASNPQ